MTFSRYFMSIALTIATLGGLGSALAHSGATGIVKERMDMFKRSQKNLKAIKSQIRVKTTALSPNLPMKYESGR